MTAAQMLAWSVPLVVGVLFLLCCGSLIVAIRFGRFLYDRSPGRPPRETRTPREMMVSRGGVRGSVQRLQLTPIEREIIVAHFDQQYTDRGMWADIKLESFVEMIREGRPTESVPVFFAQRRVIREFAHEHGLLWLYDMLRTPKVTHDLAESSAKETA